MNLFDLLTKKNNVPDYSQNMPPLQAQPVMEPIQLDKNGALIPGVEIQPEKPITIEDRLRNKTNNFSNKLTDALFGVSAKATDNVDTNGDMITATVSENPRSGGILQNIRDGYRENVSTPFKIENFEPNKNKNFSYRLGEGLGSVARIGESPSGRALLTAGLVGLTGGGALPALTFGAMTGNLNQINRMNDKLYRNDLINTKQQALMNSPEFNQMSEAEQKQILDGLHTDSNYMGLNKDEAKGLNTEQYRTKLAEKQTNMKNKAVEDYLKGRQAQQLQDIANEVNNYRGYLGEKTYGNLINSQQLRDNAAWRKMYYDQNQANLREQMEFRRQQALADQAYKQMMLEFQKQKEASDRAYQNAQLGLGYARLGSDNENRRLDREEKAKDRESKILSKQTDFSDVEKQLNNFKETFKNLPKKAESYTLGNLRAITGTQTTKEANFNAQRTLLFNQIARKLGGEKGVLSDQDMKRIELALPTLTDSYEQKIAKMKAVEDLLTIRKGGTPGTYQSGKYKVRVK